MFIAGFARDSGRSDDCALCAVYNNMYEQQCVVKKKEEENRGKEKNRVIFFFRVPYTRGARPFESIYTLYNVNRDVYISCI